MAQSPAQALHDNLALVLSGVQALEATGQNVGPLLTAIEAAQTAAAQVTAAASTAKPPSPGAVAVASGVTPAGGQTTDQSQVYVSAPAAGAIALVAAVLGGVGGYAARGYLDKGNRKRVASREAAALEAGIEEESDE